MRRGTTKLGSAILSSLAILAAGYAPAQTVRVRPPAGRLFLDGATVIDPGTGSVRKNVRIEIVDGRILRVGPAAEIAAAPGAKVIDLTGKFIIPGLIDTHAHLYGGVASRHSTNDVHAPFFLACGVTTIRAPGSGNPAGDLALRDRINAGTFDGPRIYVSSAYIEADPPTVEWMNPVHTAEEVRLTIDRWAAAGATSVKLYASMKGDLMQAAIEHAHACGLKAIAHIGAATYEEAISAGIDEIFHGISVMSDLVPPGVDQRRYFDWFKAVLAMDLSRPEFRRILKLAAETKTVLTPTAAVFDEFDPASPYMTRLKPFYSDPAWQMLVKRAAQKPMLENADKITALNLRFVKEAYEVGCILTTGTDKTNIVPPPGFSLWQEMDAFARAGLPPMAILKAATFNGAYALGVSDLLGSIEAGKLADLVVLDTDPLAATANIDSVYRVIKAGVVYDPQEILKKLAGRIE